MKNSNELFKQININDIIGIDKYTENILFAINKTVL